MLIMLPLIISQICTAESHNEEDILYNTNIGTVHTDALMSESPLQSDRGKNHLQDSSSKKQRTDEVISGMCTYCNVAHNKYFVNVVHIHNQAQLRLESKLHTIYMYMFIGAHRYLYLPIYVHVELPALSTKEASLKKPSPKKGSPKKSVMNETSPMKAPLKASKSPTKTVSMRRVSPKRKSPKKNLAVTRGNYYSRSCILDIKVNTRMLYP